MALTRFTSSNLWLRTWKAALRLHFTLQHRHLRSLPKRKPSSKQDLSRVRRSRKRRNKPRKMLRRLPMPQWRKRSQFVLRPKSFLARKPSRENPRSPVQRSQPQSFTSQITTQRVTLRFTIRFGGTSPKETSEKSTASKPRRSAQNKKICARLH